ADGNERRGGGNMNVNRRWQRDGLPRGAAQPAPRSGGRTAAQRTPRTDGIRPVAARRARVGGTRDFPVQGSAALRPRERADEPPAVQVWDSSHEPELRREPARTRVSRTQLRVAPPPPVVRPRAPFVALILLLVVGGVLGILLVQTKVNENAVR